MALHPGHLIDQLPDTKRAVLLRGDDPWAPVRENGQLSLDGFVPRIPLSTVVVAVTAVVVMVAKMTAAATAPTAVAFVVVPIGPVVSGGTAAPAPVAPAGLVETALELFVPHGHHGLRPSRGYRPPRGTNDEAAARSPAAPGAFPRGAWPRVY